MFDFSRTFRGVNTDFFFNFSDIFLISPTSDPSDFLLNRAVRAVCAMVLYIYIKSFRNYVIFCSTIGMCEVKINWEFYHSIAHIANERCHGNVKVLCVITHNLYMVPRKAHFCFYHIKNCSLILTDYCLKTYVWY